MKDYQQLKIIQRLVHALHFPTAIVPVPTVREADGLAMSSRNTYLNEKERASAPTIYEALEASRARFRGGERSSEALAGTARRVFMQRPLITEDYIAVVDPESLEPIPSIQDRAVMLIAARVGGIRLIDNILLDSRERA